MDYGNIINGALRNIIDPYDEIVTTDDGPTGFNRLLPQCYAPRSLAGLGIRFAPDFLGSAYLASISDTVTLQGGHDAVTTVYVSHALSHLNKRIDTSAHIESPEAFWSMDKEDRKQNALSQLIRNHSYNTMILGCKTQADYKRLISLASSPNEHHFLTPTLRPGAHVSSMGNTALKTDEFLYAISRRLGITLFTPNPCPAVFRNGQQCDGIVDPLGLHCSDLCPKYYYPKHERLLNTLMTFAREAGYAVKKDAGVLPPSSNLKPADCEISGFPDGLNRVVDTTVATCFTGGDHFKPYFPISAPDITASVRYRETKKRRDYVYDVDELLRGSGRVLVPFVVNGCGLVGSPARKLVAFLVDSYAKRRFISREQRTGYQNLLQLSLVQRLL